MKANKYDLSASRYRQVEQDEEFYEQPRVTLERLRQLEAVATGEVTALDGILARIAYHHLRHVGLQQVVQPGGPGPFWLPAVKSNLG